MDEYSILKKKQKKNAFAATSLLISIAIALLVLVGAVLILGKVDNQQLATTNDDSANTSTSEITCIGLTKEMVFNTNIRDIKEAAISYFTNERLPQTVGETEKITLKQMKEKKLIVNVVDATGKSCSDDETYVEVTKEDNEYVMKIFLSCSDSSDYILVHLGCYDYCDKDVCEKKEKTYEYEYKKTTSCVMTDWSNWGEWKLTREKTSNLKKEDTKVESTTKVVTDTKSATANVTYNCDKYPGYTLEGNKCVKKTTTKDVKDATPSKYSYNCDKYPGYSVVGDKCVKETKVKEVIDATKNPITYSCPSGYTLNGTKCEKYVTKTDTKNGTYVCPSDYTLSGTKCVKTTTSTSTIDATAVYDTRMVKKNETCYRNICTTKTVFSCPTGKTCGNYPQTSCNKVKTTCEKEVEETYISGYSCPAGYTKNGTKCTITTTSTDTKNATFTCPSGYDVNNGKCSKTTTSTDTKNATFTCPSGYDVNNGKCSKTTITKYNRNATFTCPSGYSVNNGKCTKSYREKEIINATKDPITYYCKAGYSLVGTKCERTVIKKDTKDATKVAGGYVCSSGYTLNGTKCTKTTTTRDVKDASSNTKYSCPSGYTLDGKACVSKETKTVKTTYYRYATRSCNGGSTDTRWSTSQNDSILKSEGYKLTGNKREVKEIVK